MKKEVLTRVLLSCFMTQGREIRVRVTKDQLDRIKLNAQAKGFKNISSYMRYLCLEYNNHVEHKIIETNKILKEMTKTEPIKDKNNTNILPPPNT